MAFRRRVTQRGFARLKMRRLEFRRCVLVFCHQRVKRRVRTLRNSSRFDATLCVGYNARQVRRNSAASKRIVKPFRYVAFTAKRDNIEYSIDARNLLSHYTS